MGSDSIDFCLPAIILRLAITAAGLRRNRPLGLALDPAFEPLQWYYLSHDRLVFLPRR